MAYLDELSTVFWYVYISSSDLVFADAVRQEQSEGGAELQEVGKVARVQIGRAAQRNVVLIFVRPVLIVAVRGRSSVIFIKCKTLSRNTA